MPSLVQFDVVFDKPVSVFQPGQDLRGCVLIRIAARPDGKPFKTRGVELRLQGRAQVRWTERETRQDAEGNKETVTVVYSNQEDYFNRNILLYGISETSLPPGDHSFPFSFTLPLTLPSSFESKFGSVRYWAKAKIIRPWKFDREVKIFFTIDSLLDLNVIPAAKKTGHQMDHMHLCCLCCKYGPISAVLDISKVGYVPGEDIILNAEVYNKSSQKMNRNQCKLQQICSCTAASGKTKRVHRTVAKLGMASIDPGKSDVWSSMLTVPPLPPTGLDGCSFIDVSYFLEFQVKPAGLKLVQPIIIGTIPLVQSFHNFSNPVVITHPPALAAANCLPSYDELHGGKDNAAFDDMEFRPSAPLNPYLDQYPDLPPPTYSEALMASDNSRMDMRSEEDGEHTRGNWEFVPLYVTYSSNYQL